MNDSLIGKRLANFQIERLLGKGGMAEVYFGRDVSLQRPVAIKVINAQFRDDPAYAERFVSEARAVATWRHENIVQVYYAGKQENLYYFVMEYVDGVDLSTLLDQYKHENELMPHEDVIRIAYAVASALDYAHKKGVIHRDVKPANTMISTDDRVVLMDFGLALDVQQGSIGEVFGTPHYVSPEQAMRSADAVPQSDVYSLGIMLYQMLTGFLPFDDPSPTAVAMQHISEPPPSPRSLNPDLSINTEEVLLKSLEKSPEDRYQTATAFVEALETALLEKPESLSLTEPPPLPAGTNAPNLSISKRTVADRVALNINQTRTEAKPDIERIPKTRETPRSTKAGSAPPPPQPTKRQSSNMGWIFGGVLLILLVIVIGLLVAGSSGNNGEADTVVDQPTLMPTFGDQGAGGEVPTELPSAEPTAEPTQEPTDNPPTATDAPPTDVPATHTEIPATDVPATATDIPPTPTATSTEPPSATPPPEPTVLYPTGRRVHLLWNDSSFYWYNPTGDSVRVSPLDFEALDANGNSAGYFLDGIRWTIGFNRVESDKCVAIELLQTSNWVRPSQCRGYNSTLTLPESSDEVFWLARDNVTQFRVLWEGQEVGRCDLIEQFCRVRIPAE